MFRTMLGEFREFAVKGNVIDMGVGIVIGAAFTSIVRSFVDDIVTPILGVFTGGIDFSYLFVDLSGEEYATLAAAQEAGAATLNYGHFINALISFLIVAWALFFVVKAINRLKREFEAEVESKPSPEEAPPPMPADIALLREIRDLLAAQSSQPSER